MDRRAFLGMCGVGLAGLAQVPLWAAPSGPSVKVGLTTTIFPGLSEAMLKAAARPFKSLLESATGVTGEIVQGGDSRGLADKLKSDRVQLGVFQGIEFAWARVSNARLEPIVICANQQRTLKALLVVRSASGFKSPGDLAGKILTEPAETREHCKVFLERKCVPASSTVKKFYKKVVLACDVEEALDEVVDGNAQAALVDALAWASYRRAKAGCARKLRVLLESDIFPCAVIACQKDRFEPERVQRFRDGLIGSRNSPRGRQLLEFLRITGFEAIPSDYDQLFASIVKSYPPPAR
jgi:ABC-type phosphate/phosphonate transport system substrate-binding protein